ncbi:MAG TPA: glycosyltransferase family 39 protein [Candidatus Binatia bacterium]|jgi:hypothetical protein
MIRRISNFARFHLANTDENWRIHTLIIVGLTLLTRLPYRSHLLFDHDSVQFALGLREYDVYLHQPHPPGYFLYLCTAKLINYALHDVNTSLVLVSVVASGLAVGVIYNLGSALFDRQTGWWAAIIAATSPLFWFFGEVALSYPVATFFSSLIALSAWRVYNRDNRWAYPLSVFFGIAVGFRQDLGIFLGPLWLLALSRCKPRVMIFAVTLTVITIALWFLPMLVATGGAARYFAANSELWQYNNEPKTIWYAPLSTRIDTLLTLIGVLSYGIGLGTICLLSAAYFLVRFSEWRTIQRDKLLFFFTWVAPAVLFFIVVFIPPYKYSYGLVLLPAFWVTTPVAVWQVLSEIKRLPLAITARVRHAHFSILLWVIMVSNLVVFCLSGAGFSVSALQQHERILSLIFTAIRQNFPSDRTLILGHQSSTFSGFRHVQYYLPEYRVYLADQQVNVRGQRWYAFGAWKGKTILNDAVRIPANVDRIVYLADPYFPESNQDLKLMNLHALPVYENYAIYFEELPTSNHQQFDSFP